MLSDMATNEWIQHLEAIRSKRTTAGTSLRNLQIQYFGIYASATEQIFLSHSSILFIHRQVYVNPWLELERDLEYVHQIDKYGLIDGKPCFW